MLQRKPTCAIAWVVLCVSILAFAVPPAVTPQQVKKEPRADFVQTTTASPAVKSLAPQAIAFHEPQFNTSAVPLLGIMAHGSASTPTHFARLAASLRQHREVLDHVAVVTNRVAFAAADWTRLNKTIEELRGLVGPSRLTVIDVPSTLLGVADGWNSVSATALQFNASWWMITACDVSFPPNTLRDVVHSVNVIGRLTLFQFKYTAEKAAAWNAFVVTHAVWQRVGAFDEQFYPAYWEDIDYKIRLARESITLRVLPITLEHPEQPAIHSNSLFGCRAACVSAWFGRPYLRLKWPNMTFVQGPFGNPALPSSTLPPRDAETRSEITRMMNGKGAAYKALCDCADCSQSKGHWRRRWTLGTAWARQPSLPIDFLKATGLFANDSAPPKVIELPRTAANSHTSALLKSLFLA